MSDIIGFVYGAICGFSLATVLFIECVKTGHCENREGSRTNIVKNPNQNRVFVGHQPTGSLDTSNPPQGGTGVPQKRNG